MTNDRQKKLLEEIKEPVFNLKRMNQIVELLCMMVEDNTVEKEAKDDLIKVLKDNNGSGARKE